MSLFGAKLVDVESRLFDNLKTTLVVFPEETHHLEAGLASGRATVRKKSVLLQLSNSGLVSRAQSRKITNALPVSGKSYIHYAHMGE
jgi:hypothetical protein